MTLIGCIIQARMTSTRLPGKVLMPLKDGKSVLEFVLERLGKAKMLDLIVVAMTDRKEDDLIAELCQSLGVAYFRGSEDNVLERFYLTAKKYGMEHIVRVTSDCPAIDPEIVDQLCQFYLGGSFDYVSNILSRTFPRGLDTEIFSFKALDRTYREAQELSELEHVTPYIYGNTKKFKVGIFRGDGDDYSQYRLTIDTAQDLALARKVFEKLEDNFKLEDLVKVFEKNPELDSSDLGKQKYQSSQHYLENLEKT